MRALALTIHIAAGALGLVSGYVALSTAKGAIAHRRSGTVFVYAMLTMSLVGAMIALAWRVAPAANAPIGMLTAYLVITALVTVRPASPTSLAPRRIDAALLVLVAGLALDLLATGAVVAASPTGKLYGMPSIPFFVFGSIALLAAVGDARLVRAGGVQTVRGSRRIARHLWRMCVALLIAAFSFFIGQAKVFPKPMRIYPLLMVPPLVVLAALLYWLWRVRVRRSLRNLVLASSRPPSDRPTRAIAEPV